MASFVRKFVVNTTHCTCSCKRVDAGGRASL